MNEIKLGGIKSQKKQRPKKSRPLAPPKNSPDKDIWMTPETLARDIVNHFQFNYQIFCDNSMIEPCRGTGSFFNAMKKAVSPQNVDWCELSEGVDFLEKDFCGQKYDWLITNFPFSKYADFLQKSMTLADNIVSYGTVCHILSLKKRLRLIKEAGFFIREILYTDTPKEWRTGGFACGAIYLNKQAGDCKISYLQ